jgi:hypothetical protein
MPGEYMMNIIHTFLTLELDGDEMSASCSNCFTTSERVPGIQRTGGRVDFRTSLDMVENKEIPASARNQTPVFNPVVSH